MNVQRNCSEMHPDKAQAGPLTRLRLRRGVAMSCTWLLLMFSKMLSCIRLKGSVSSRASWQACMMGDKVDAAAGQTGAGTPASSSAVCRLHGLARALPLTAQRNWSSHPSSGKRRKRLDWQFPPNCFPTHERPQGQPQSHTPLSPLAALRSLRSSLARLGLGPTRAVLSSSKYAGLPFSKPLSRRLLSAWANTSCLA